MGGGDNSGGAVCAACAGARTSIGASLSATGARGRVRRLRWAGEIRGAGRGACGEAGRGGMWCWDGAMPCPGRASWGPIFGGGPWEGSGLTDRLKSLKALDALAPLLTRAMTHPDAPRTRDAFPLAPRGRALLASAENPLHLGTPARTALRPPNVEPTKLPHEGPSRRVKGWGAFPPRGALSRRGDQERQRGERPLHEEVSGAPPDDAQQGMAHMCPRLLRGPIKRAHDMEHLS